VARHRFVGGNHELFDDPMGNIALGAHDIFRLPLQIENNFSFG
jgi:hypothetical protein